MGDRTEVGELPPEVQVKLLRVLQEREVEPVGGTRPVPVDLRVIAATRRNLEQMVVEGTFREDLYYLLNVIRISLPPLRERGGDVLEIASHVLADLNDKYGTPKFFFERNGKGLPPLSLARKCAGSAECRPERFYAPQLPDDRTGA